MKKVCVLTATRAEYGLLKTVIKKLKQREEIDVRVVVTGAHLSSEFGLTYREIAKDGINIDKKIEILLSSDSTVSVSKSMGLAMISFAEYFHDSKPDLLVVLGDRYETIAVCLAAMNERIPIAHLHGGETTEGAIDEAIRHSITKMSSLHFVSTEKYRKRVIQLGEHPNTVFNVGAMGVENALKTKLLSRDELQKALGIELRPHYAVVTFHPVTLENDTAEQQVKEVLEALVTFDNFDYIITKANADASGRSINNIIDEFCENRDNMYCFYSLGVQRYLSAVKYADMVIGNSSSGLIEVPSFGIPTINIGDRQKGRIKAESVFDCEPSKEDIINTINLAINKKDMMGKIVNPYEGVNTSEEIVNIICEFVKKDKNVLMKKFYDL